MESSGEASRRGYQPSEKTEELSKAVSQFEIQAQVSNGEVVRVVYEEQEDMWVVNFKKGILDALQVRTDVDTPRNIILVVSNCEKSRMHQNGSTYSKIYLYEFPKYSYCLITLSKFNIALILYFYFYTQV